MRRANEEVNQKNINVPIENPKLRDMAVMFNYMLAATKEVFGKENLTENVMMKALEASSYCVWRGIMGGKNENQFDYDYGIPVKKRY